MYKSLATKYRPQDLDSIVEQQAVVRILKQIVASGKPKNAYIFAGPSGTGKTTAARAFASALNNGQGAPIEIDAASNNGVDNVRAIIEAAQERSLTSTYKIYILDEAHMLTTEAENALLKIIEDPPTYTIFIFCTTEPNKLPATLLNRMQRYNIAKISNAGIKSRLEYICQQEGFTNYADTCDLISKMCSGCMRDAITTLEQCADYSTDLCLENTKQILGDISQEVMLKLTNFLIDGDEAKIFAVIETLYNNGQDLKQFISNYLEFVLDLNKYILFQDITLTNIPAYLEKPESAEDSAKVQYVIGIEDNLNWFNRLADRLLEIKQAIKIDTSCKSTIEAYLLRTCRGL